MPELRKDPVVGRWVIIATERARRPSDFVTEPVRPRASACAFCEGHEQQTPPEILAGRPPDGRPNGPGWTYRVVPDKFPALRIEGELEPSAGRRRGPRSHRPGHGHGPRRDDDHVGGRGRGTVGRGPENRGHGSRAVRARRSPRAVDEGGE